MSSQNREATKPRGKRYDDSAKALSVFHNIFKVSSRILICGHQRADGDCVGSMAALYHFLKREGREVRLYFRGPLQDLFRPYLPEGQDEKGDYPVDFDADLTVCLDAASSERVTPDFHEKVRGVVLNIDHHGDNTCFGDHNWIDSSYAATGEMLHEIIGSTPHVWTSEIADSLFLAIATDTGSFRYGNTTARTLETAACLVRHGAQPARIAQHVWGNRSMEAVRIQAAVLDAMRFEIEGKLVWSEIRRELLDANGGDKNEPDNLTGELRGIRGVRVALLMRERAEGGVRASIRSGGAVDVNQTAARFGGGGHQAASGFTVEGDYEETRDRIVREVVADLADRIGA